MESKESDNNNSKPPSKRLIKWKNILNFPASTMEDASSIQNRILYHRDVHRIIMNPSTNEPYKDEETGRHFYTGTKDELLFYSVRALDDLNSDKKFFLRSPPGSRVPSRHYIEWKKQRYRIYSRRRKNVLEN